MKKTLFFLFCIITFALTGCVNYHGTTTSIWGDGVWLAPTLPFVGGLILMFMGYKASKSGSKINPIYGGGEGGNVPFWQTGWPILGAICLASSIAIVFIQYGER